MNKITHTQFIKDAAYQLGFSIVGVAPAHPLTEEAKQLETWLNQGRHGSMKYMENHFEKRTDPTQLFPGAKSIICLAFNYFNPEKQQDTDAPKLSKYAYGKDYHQVLKKKLFQLVEKIQEKIPDFQSKVAVDSVPIMERQWAQKAGLGWLGKNTLLINNKKGSYFFLSEIICDIELAYDYPINDFCGTCTACIDACPTNALQPYLIDAQKCISYLTIELKEEIPASFAGKMENWMFGCDICQDVCPWNRFSSPHQEPDFNPHPDLLVMKKEEWENLDLETFNLLFKKSAVKRAKYDGLKKNIEFSKTNRNNS